MGEVNVDKWNSSKQGIINSFIILKYLLTIFYVLTSVLSTEISSLPHGAYILEWRAGQNQVNRIISRVCVW